MTRRGQDAATELQCAWCGKIRVAGRGFVPEPREGHLDEDRSHGICPPCLRLELGRAVEETVVSG